MAHESIEKRMLRWLSKRGLCRSKVLPAVERIFFMEPTRNTGNGSNVAWLGKGLR